MNVIKAKEYIESSFIKELLQNSDITDISYNGKNIYYLDNFKGRCISQINVDYQTIKDFIRQIANLCEKQFSYQDPILDVSFDKYRINAIHQSIGRYKNGETITFCIRISSLNIRELNDGEFMNNEIFKLLNLIMKSNCSIVIGGLTGTGKTELQKYLINLIEENSHLIVIDNVLEMAISQNSNFLDISLWQINENNYKSNISNLVKTALRNNPDWLIIAESRGEEMNDILISAQTGHPIITTIHSYDLESMPGRMTRMIMQADKKSEYSEIYKDLVYQIRFYIYLKRKIINGRVSRFIEKIGYYNKAKMEIIYDSEKNIIYPLSDECISSLNAYYITDDLRKLLIRRKS